MTVKQSWGRFKRENNSKLESEKLFLPQRIKECKHYYMFVKFPWRPKGVKPKVQSIGVIFFQSFHLKLFLVLPENSFH